MADISAGGEEQLDHVNVPGLLEMFTVKIQFPPDQVGESQGTGRSVLHCEDADIGRIPVLGKIRILLTQLGST